jgi:hypothetical protein
VALYLGLVMAMIVNSDIGRVRRQSALQDEGRIAIPIWAPRSPASPPSCSGCAPRGKAKSTSCASSPGCSDHLLSWAFIHIMFALHYAHEY